MGWLNEIRKAFALLASIPKSLIFNLYYLPLYQAIRLPIWVSYRLKLRNLGGAISLGEYRCGIVRIGFNSLGMITGQGDGMWDVHGDIRFDGKTRIGCHPVIQVYGKLRVGKNFDTGHQTKLFCRKNIDIGEDVLLSWNVEIMDHDGHDIMETGHGNIVNPPAAVSIGNHCWIGCHATLLKGSRLASDSVVGARSLVSDAFAESHCLIAGNPAKILKRGLTWRT